MDNNNIAITGQGIISAIGNGKDAVLQSLREGRTGICTMKYLNSTHNELPVGEVGLSNNEMMTILNLPASEELSRTTLLGMTALNQAIIESRLKDCKRMTPQKRIVLISGTTVAGMDITERYFDTFEKSDEHIASLGQHDCGSCTETIARHFGLFDECASVSTACSSAANAIIVGANMLRARLADIVVAGGTEALSRFHLNGFNSLQILDHNICRPFDDKRAGLNLGEGAAYIVLEREDEARERNADIYGYINGYGNACDAFHQTASSPNGEGAYRAMTAALRMAGLKPSDIHYVNAHGTGTLNNDFTESVALKRVFGEKMPFVSSTKSFTGHTTSASGCIETVICLLVLKHCFIPPNLGWANPMTDGIVPSLGEEHETINHVLCNSFGFGGNDSSIIISRCPTNCDTWGRHDDECDVKIASQVEITQESELGEIRNYVNPMEVRRMGKIMKSALLASLKALELAGIESPDAIITATAWGCLDYSERLLKQLHDEGEVLLKPTYFMQSTHNTISSTIAIHLKCHGYNITYSHGSHSLELALRDARMLLQSGQCRNVLVGIHDETTALFRSLLERLGIDIIPSSIYSKAIVMTANSPSI